MSPKIFKFIGSSKVNAQPTTKPSKATKSNKAEKSAKASASAKANTTDAASELSVELTPVNSKADKKLPKLPPSASTSARPRRSSLKKESSPESTTSKTVRFAESRNTEHFYIAHPSTPEPAPKKTTKGLPKASLLTPEELKRRDAVSKGGIDPEILKKLGFKG